jgi:hypothetical protein
MPTTTDLTPAEITALEREIAEKVMGWKRAYTYRVDIRPLSDCWRDTEEGTRYIGEPLEKDRHLYWSPWENLADAREVLKRLVEILASEQEGPEPPAWTIVCYKWGAAMRHLVSVGAVSAYHDDGPHEGPAICLLARKVMEGNHAQVK